MALVPVRGMAVTTGEQTGDGRYIVPGGVSAAPLPLPLAWLVDGDQHADLSEMCPQIGNLTALMPTGVGVSFSGVIDDAIPVGAEAIRRMRAGSAPGGSRFFVSIDPDDWAVQLCDMSPEEESMTMLLMASGSVPAGERFDWNAPVQALRRARMVPALTAAAGDGDPVELGGSVLVEDSADSIIARFTRLRVRGLTMCSVSAFSNCYLELDDSAAGMAPSTVLAAADAEEFKALPVHHTATSNSTWDGPAATANASGAAQLRYMHAWQDSSAGADPDVKASYKFPHHAAGTDTAANLNGVRNALSRLPQADIPDGDRAGVQRHLQAHLDDGGSGSAARTAASAPARVAVNLAAPPASWFEDPALPFATPLTITNEGRVLGHIAAWGTCHTGYTDRCLTPPRGAYDRFHVGESACSDGSSAPVGVFAWGIPHAGLTLPLIQAYEHYSNSRYGFSRVAAGEDRYGIWFSGALFPGLSDNDIAILRALSMSGDWRRDPATRKLSLVAALAVNFPGYPIPRSDAEVAAGGLVLEAPDPTMELSASGEIVALVACGRLAPRARLSDCGCGEGPELRVRQLEERQARTDRLLSLLAPAIAEQLDRTLGNGNGKK